MKYKSNRTDKPNSVPDGSGGSHLS